MKQAERFDSKTATESPPAASAVKATAGSAARPRLSEEDARPAGPVRVSEAIAWDEV